MPDEAYVSYTLGDTNHGNGSVMDGSRRRFLGPPFTVGIGGPPPIIQTMAPRPSLVSHVQVPVTMLYSNGALRPAGTVQAVPQTASTGNTEALNMTKRRLEQSENEKLPPKKRKTNFVQHDEERSAPSPTTSTNSGEGSSHVRLNDKPMDLRVKQEPRTQPQCQQGASTTAAPAALPAIPTPTHGPVRAAVPVPFPGPTVVDPRVGIVSGAEIQMASWQDEDGDTPLHIAVVQGNIPLIERLLTLLSLGNKSVDTYNHLRQAPLHLAVITSQWPIVRMLVLAGACADLQDRNGQTAVHLACQRASMTCLHTLITCTKHQLDLDIRNYEGLTPLHIAVNTGNKDVVAFLVESGADIEATDGKSGRTALFYAVEGNQEDIVEYLLGAGAKVNSQCYAGNTPLHTASGRGQQNMVKMLIKHGADIGVKNCHNDTPLAVVNNKTISQMLRGRFKPAATSSTTKAPTQTLPITAFKLAGLKVPPVLRKVAQLKDTPSAQNSPQSSTDSQSREGTPKMSEQSPAASSASEGPT
ncbi:PREDICTED: B-cell lymphoma 3 protein homolog isoform X1 [Branchiostoma belcheri]|uniref:B-cell lymphoma 3 protein homolog isoform X1 n=1 Tax=Branchiostoma belcheri TaxID=7741 RepID=A0A6P5A5W2_BRABE|nr:PREDICTED: B-cell lymphoma 3 protein homolog isoform X1 [Branchiostoma belcheri]